MANDGVQCNDEQSAALTPCFRTADKLWVSSKHWSVSSPKCGFNVAWKHMVTSSPRLSAFSVVLKGSQTETTNSGVPPFEEEKQWPQVKPGQLCTPTLSPHLHLAPWLLQTPKDRARREGKKQNCNLRPALPCYQIPLQNTNRKLKKFL